jgi:hypothetical protein
LSPKRDKHRAAAVSATIDHETVLSHRKHWIAHPAAPVIAEVDFLIAGNYAGRAPPPYAFSELAGDGYLEHGHSDGWEARVGDARPDVVLMDVRMLSLDASPLPAGPAA